MPSPIGHTVAGFCGYLLAPKGLIPKPPLNTLIASVVLANLPDIDILPGLLLGNPTLFHRQGTHSIAAGIAVGIIVGILASVLGRTCKQASIRLGLWAVALFFSHIFLDLLVTDPSPPRGVQLFWPFSNDYFISPITVFGGFDYFDSELGMIRSMLTVKNLMTTIREFVLMLPVYFCSRYLAHHLKERQR
jgi:inner membrane protein